MEILIFCIKRVFRIFEIAPISKLRFKPNPSKYKKGFGFFSDKLTSKKHCKIKTGYSLLYLKVQAGLKVDILY